MNAAPAVVSELVEVGASAVARGLALASGGNLSARVGDHDAFVVTSSGAFLDRLTEDQFSVVSLDGEVLGGHPRPSSEWKLHHRTYRARPDVAAVVHLHPQYAVLVDALGYPVRMMTLDHAYYVRSVGVAPYHPNGSDELADAAAAEATRHNCVILRHHGCSAVGATVEMAHRRALNLEEAAIATYRALALGDTTTSFPPSELDALHHA